MCYNCFELLKKREFCFTEQIINIDRMENAVALFGSFDGNIKLIEKQFNVRVTCRDSELKVEGDAENTSKACKVIESLLQFINRGEALSEQNIRYCISLVNEGSEDKIEQLAGDCICITSKGKPIKPKTIGQKRYCSQIAKNTVTIGVGPAGTGKTYLAVAMAVTAFRSKQINRIILTRPAVEAGEKLGFLPGDLQSKVDPYLRPLYDALYQIMGAESFQKNMEKGLIEVAPLAYMRGRTLDNAFIILDEAQNTTPAQMKMFLTRIGFGSKAVITGDATQKDLSPGTTSGLDVALKVLKKVDEIGICELTSQDVVRHPVVQKIVKAYEDYESKHEKIACNGSLCSSCCWMSDRLWRS